ncbi:MAG: hypothetical protein ACLFPJ_03845 [Candidatus Woesearchaeota archaeon]
MTLEAICVETDPGKKKEIKLSGKLRGSSSLDANLNEILQPYSLKDGSTILGTKAVIINVNGFMQEFLEKYNLSTDIIDELNKKINNYSTYKIDGAAGFKSYFWDNTSQVHHRDIMSNYFKNLEKQLNVIYEEKMKKEYFTDEEFEKEFKKIENLDTALTDLNEGLEQLYKTKKSGKQELTKAGELILKYSQGYQLSSNNIEEKNDLWKSQIRRVELSSGITKDQDTYSIKIPKNETRRSVQYFLNCLENVEYKTNTFEMPKSAGYIGESIDVLNVATHRKKNGDYLSKEGNIKTLRINYTKN